MKKNRKMDLFKLELLNFLRDKISLLLVILLPLVIFPILILSSMNMRINANATHTTREIYP